MSDYKVPIFKAAAVQACPVLHDEPVYFDTPATLDKACKLIREAAAQGARLVVFPEAFLPTFPFWSINVGQPFEWNVIWKEYVKASVEVPGPETEVLCRAAKESGAYLVIGINERDKHYGGRMYNAALFISPATGIMGVHRKISPTLGELLYHTRGDGGDNLKIHKTEIGTIGSLICGEHTQPSLLHNMVLQGEEINCSLWPGTRKWGAKAATKSFDYSLDTEIQIMTRAVCMVAGMYSISASHYIPEDQRPKNFYPNACFERLGGSSIVNPMGEYIAGPVYEVETILYADIDLGYIPMLKSIRNLTGIYSRWDIISLAVRQNSYDPVMPLESCGQGGWADSGEKNSRLEARIKLLETEIQALKEKLK